MRVDSSFEGVNVDLLREVIDFVLPLLPPYELSVYLLLLRRSHLATGQPVIQIGKRSISQALGKMTRSSGNYQQITEKLANLEHLGFIRIGETDRLGTNYTVLLPYEVPMIRERMTTFTPDTDPDYYNDTELRRVIFERGEWRCKYCGDLIDALTGTLDHVRPVSKGGGNEAENLVACCMMCNSIKAGRTYEEAAPQMLERLARRTRSN